MPRATPPYSQRQNIGPLPYKFDGPEPHKAG
ncbi:hypothetical protein CfE428DRAFT_3921 [Chthoniobacter flavus Ellin428]|uniref:Uncharacterized protein n=1 Tax=Chthoniobacter flavus Ellin428 TaxID=497964 RepID=B4D4T3_9BACT|nr:hypothetical protein CfE428DRAFT_3921 [Chthoniobacter flavus Ellin428]TCO91008.1 hypothetical protein EV701_109158 [Chthoniobacter flavus]